MDEVDARGTIAHSGEVQIEWVGSLARAARQHHPHRIGVDVCKGLVQAFRVSGGQSRAALCRCGQERMARLRLVLSAVRDY